MNDDSTSSDNCSALPAVSQRPHADVVIYDGNCPFCRSQVSRLAGWDGGGRLAFLSAHDPLAAERYPDLPLDHLMTQMYVIDGRGRPHGGAAALRYLSRRLPRLWPLVPLLHIPFSLPLWQWIYRQVATRRYRLMSGGPVCDGGTCQILSPRKNSKSDSAPDR